jgi:GST-like protein
MTGITVNHRRYLMIDVYTWPTPNGHKVHIMLQETGLEHTIHAINIQQGDQFQPDFLKISPNNKMPAIIDRDGPDGKEIAVFESAAILIYLANKTANFLPQEPQKYYDVLQWLMFQMASVGPMLGQAHHFHAYAPERFERDKLQYGIDRYVNEASRIYVVIDRRLDGREWIAADEYTIADMAIMPWLRDPAKQGVDIEKYPHLQRWRDKIWQRPAVLRALETLAEQRRTSNAMSDKAWEIMYGKTQAGQGQSGAGQS